MKYSIVALGPHLLPSVWPVESSTESGVLAEAKEMRMSKLHLHPALLIEWDSMSVKRLAVSSNPEQEPKIMDNAGELFGIATTAEHFEEIAQAIEAEEQSV